MKSSCRNIRNIIQNRKQLFKQTLISSKEVLPKIWLPIGLILTYFVIVISQIAEKLAFIPDWLDLNTVNPQDYFGLIVTAIASIFGIVK